MAGGQSYEDILYLVYLFPHDCIQGMALSLGDKINLSQKKATSAVDPTPAGSKEGSSS